MRLVACFLRKTKVLTSQSFLTRRMAMLHSEPQRIAGSTMHIRVIPALDDNFMYLLVDEATKQCAAVDPVEPEKVAAAVDEEGAKLTCILTTHHHWDHAHGNKKLCQLKPGVDVYGGEDRVEACTHIVKHGRQLQIGSLHVKCLHTPCHTTGHICYFVTDANNSNPTVFTGDTLFQAGCGRFLEGTPVQMLKAMDILSELPKDTRVFCGHEYTINNLKFATEVEPSNADVQKQLAWAQAQRSKKLPTVPSTIEQEQKFNPFMRVREESVKEFTGRTDPVEVMEVVRQKKDSFKAK